MSLYISGGGSSSACSVRRAASHPPPRRQHHRQRHQQHSGGAGGHQHQLQQNHVHVPFFYHANFDHVSSRWGEGVPLTSSATGDGGAQLSDRQTAGDEAGSATLDSASGSGSDEDEPKTWRGKVYKFFKILAPHVVLISLLLAYLSFGALTLTWLESGVETDKRRAKLGRLAVIYERIANETWRHVRPHSSGGGGEAGLSQANWTALLRRHLLAVGQIHEGDRYLVDVDNYPDVDSRWTFPTALLYALTVLTTCGYGEVGVYTAAGQLFAVAFALVGIPLMFITAADIGKFLSETLLKLVELSKVAEVRMKAVWHRYMRRKRRASMAAGGGAPTPGVTPFDDGDPDEMEMELGPEQVQKLWFPIITYVSVISGYCCLGAVMFRAWQLHWPFIYAFHFGFNLIMTVGLGEIVVTDPIFLILIVAFVIIGLSVVTMCVDLASTHLKAYFARIHYFGRAKKFLDMGDDIRNMMEYLAWVRRKRGGQVTWRDVKELMETIRLGPFAPRDAARMRWIDESTASALSTARHNSLGAESVAAAATGGSAPQRLSNAADYRLPGRETPPPPPAPPVANHNKRPMLYGNYLPPRPPSIVPPTPSSGSDDSMPDVPTDNRPDEWRSAIELRGSPVANSRPLPPAVGNLTSYRRPVVDRGRLI